MYNIYDSIIIGGGPAGLSAMLYMGRALTNTLLIEKRGAGGQVASTDRIDNYLGFPKGIEAFELIQNMETHALAFSKNEIEYEDIVGFKDLDKEVKTVIADGGKEYKTKTIILATGTLQRKLDAKNEDNFLGRGVSYCATCDGAFYKDKTVAVVGGGNSAFDEAHFLTRFVKHIYLIHRRKEFRADMHSIKMLEATGKLEYVLDSVIEEVNGDKTVQSINVKNLLDNSVKKLDVDGVFVFVGQLPATGILKDTKIELTKEGYVVVDKNMMTNIKGVFACGDAIDKTVRQVANAVGDGCVAAVNTTHYLQHLGS